MNRERLFDVVTVLEGVPDKKFDMDTWSCDTAACAVGWYCTKRRNAGLWLEDDGDGFPFPATKKSTGWSAVKEHFSLQGGEAEHLFDPTSYPPGVTRATVIARIREFVTSGGVTVPAAEPQDAERFDGMS